VGEERLVRPLGGVLGALARLVPKRSTARVRAFVPLFVAVLYFAPSRGPLLRRPQDGCTLVLLL